MKKVITSNIKDLLNKRMEVYTQRDKYDFTAQQHINEAINEAVDALAMHKGAYIVIGDYNVVICYQTYTSEYFLY